MVESKQVSCLFTKWLNGQNVVQQISTHKNDNMQGKEMTFYTLEKMLKLTSNENEKVQ